jgi:hypothetical protein
LGCQTPLTTEVLSFLWFILNPIVHVEGELMDDTQQAVA